MKNFKRFQTAYEGLVYAEKQLNSMYSRMATEYAELDFIKKRHQAYCGIEEARLTLMHWFKENFPETTVEAFASDQFSFKEFFEMLKKHPELAKENKDALQSLLCNMRAGNLRTMQIERIPELKEFVS